MCMCGVVLCMTMRGGVMVGWVSEGLNEPMGNCSVMPLCDITHRLLHNCPPVWRFVWGSFLHLTEMGNQGH